MSSGVVVDIADCEFLVLCGTCKVRIGGLYLFLYECVCGEYVLFLFFFFFFNFLIRQSLVSEARKPTVVGVDRVCSFVIGQVIGSFAEVDFT